MNKKKVSIFGWALGLSMALAGVGVAVGASQGKAIEAKADTSATFTIGWGDATGTAGTYQNFTAVSGTATVATGKTISFSSDKNSASNPAYNSNNHELRLYYHSSGNGGSVSFDFSNFGYTVTAVTMVTSTTPSVKYSVDGGTATAMSRSGTTYTLSGIEAASSLTLQNVNTSNTQLRIKTVAFTYTVPAAKTISSVDVTTQPTKTTYKTGEAFDASGLVVTVTYDDKTTSTVSYSDGTASKFSFTGFDSSTAVEGQNVTVKYSPEGEEEYTCATKVVVDIINVSPNALLVDPSDLTKDPSTYLAGETLDLTGLYIVVGYTDSSEAEYNIASNADFESKGFSIRVDGAAFDLSTPLSVSHSGKSFVVYYGALHDDSDPINVIVTPINTFTKVTDEAKIYAGMKVAIGANGIETFATTTLGGAGSNVLTNVDATVTGDIVASNDIGVFTIGGSVNAWTLSNANGVLGVTKVKELAYGKGTSTWVITISSGIAAMNSTNSALGSMKYNSGNPRFTTYASGQVDINLYAMAPENDIYAFIQDNMRMGDTNISGATSKDGQWSCSTGYTTVKAAFNALSEADRVSFFGEAAYATAAARLTAWAAANGEAFNETTKVLGAYKVDFKLNNTNNNLPFIIAIIGAGLAVSGGLFFLQRKRRKEN